VTTVVFGSNHFVDCGTLVAFGSEPILRVDLGPLRLTLVTPAALPSGRTISVVDNEGNPSSSIEVRVIKNDSSVAIFWGEQPLVIATELDADTVSLRADLRPIGINLYDDATGLHIGNMHLVGSTFSGAAVAFQLG
jgi:hypothetical protein